MTALVFDELLVRDGDRVVLEVHRRVGPGTVLVVRGTEASAVSAVLDLLVRAIDGRPASSGPLRTSGTLRLESTPTGAVRVAVAPREHGLIGGLSAVENVLLGVLAHRRATVDDERAAADLLDALGVPAAVHGNLAEQLSGGQQQRVAVARALATEAPVVALDDPVSELDDRTRVRVLSLLGTVRPDAVVLVGLPDDGGHRPDTTDDRDDAWSADAVVLRLGDRRRASGRHART